MKRCITCNVELTGRNWFPSLRAKNSKTCKACNLERTRTWRKKNPDKMQNIHIRSRAKLKENHPHYGRDWSRKNRAERRVEMLTAYGGKCLHCGIDDPEVLDIDHIDNDGAAHRKSGKRGWQLYRFLRNQGYPKDKYQLLCRNCNWKKEMARRKSRKSSCKQSRK
jgi:hypothetical protein